MAQQKNRSHTSRTANHSNSPISSDMESHDETPVLRSAQNRRRANQPQTQSTAQGQGNDLLAAMTPAFQEARRYIEGSPIRAAAVGAIAGGLLMTLFSTEKGRSFVKMAYDYANPMVAKYAREYISQAAGDMTEQALSQH